MRGWGGEGSKCRCDFLGFGDLHIVGVGAACEERYLVRMERGAAGEGVAAGPAAIGLQTFGVAEIGIKRVDRRNARRRGGVEAERAGEPIGIGPVPVLILVAGRADRGGEILGAPSEGNEPRMRRGVAAKV